MEGNIKSIIQWYESKNEKIYVIEENKMILSLLTDFIF
jgi:hypothetical protein